MNIRISILALGTLAAAAARGVPVEVPADSGETLGMVKVSKTNAVNSEIVLGIPFLKSPLGGTNTVDTLLVAGYGTNAVKRVGDTVRVWNPSKPSFRGYDMWETWPDAAGSNRWLRVQDTSSEKPAEAPAYAVNRGTAFWFADVSGDTNDLVQAGLVRTGAVTRVAAGTAATPVKTLLVNPFYTAVNAAAALAEGAAAGDQLALVNGTSRYEYGTETSTNGVAKSGWGTWRKGDIKKKIGSIIIYGPNKFVVETNITVAAGNAFWYISKGGSPTVKWDDL